VPQRVKVWALWDDFRFIIRKRTQVARRLRRGRGEPATGVGRASPSAGLGRSLRLRRGKVGLGTSRIRGRRDDGPPVYTYEVVAGVPPVSAVRLGQEPSRVGCHLAHTPTLMTSSCSPSTSIETAARCGWGTESGR